MNFLQSLKRCFFNEKIFFKNQNVTQYASQDDITEIHIFLFILCSSYKLYFYVNTPAHNMFVSHNLFNELCKIDAAKNLLLEDESMSIGYNKIPYPFWQQMKKAPIIKILVPFDLRVNRLVNEYGKVMAFSAKTLFNGDNLGLQTYSVVRVFDYITKVLIDFLNRRAFENWTTLTEKDLRSQIVKFLDTIQGPTNLIESFKIMRFERDPNVKDKINLDIHIDKIPPRQKPSVANAIMLKKNLFKWRAAPASCGCLKPGISLPVFSRAGHVPKGSPTR